MLFNDQLFRLITGIVDTYVTGRLPREMVERGQLVVTVIAN